MTANAMSAYQAHMWTFLTGATRASTADSAAEAGQRQAGPRPLQDYSVRTAMRLAPAFLKEAFGLKPLPAQLQTKLDVARAARTQNRIASAYVRRSGDLVEPEAAPRIGRV